ncbi:MAG: rhodanese-like domain-containing protein [Agarilytica sp.]
MKKCVFVGLFMFLPLFAIAEAVWIDVRTAEENKKNSIAGDALIPHKEIVPGVEALFSDKNKEIILYCRSGRRAGVAMKALQEAGYTNVSNAGGISDAKKVRKIDSCNKETC